VRLSAQTDQSGWLGGGDEHMEQEQSREASQIDALNELTQAAVRRQSTCEFAGFLTREDDQAIYVADQQGTWVIAREDLVFLEDWAYASRAPESMQDRGRPVRVGIREGATIQEIRPWTMHAEKKPPGAQLRRALEKVFALGGAPQPIGEHTILGEAKLAALERTFVRRLGWHPDPNDPRSDYSLDFPSSWTMVHFNGY
jgi:hypothetical protein